MHQAKTELSRLVRDVREGREPEILIAIDGEPVAKLVPYLPAPRCRLGIDRGLVFVADDFDAPDQDITDLFEGIERSS